MFPKYLRAFTLALALLAGPAFAADKYEFDTAHSEVGFNATHWGILKVHGSFDKFSGTLKVDEKDMSKSSVEVSIDIASVNTRVERRDGHLRGEDFFHAEKFPQATFKSTKVEADKDGVLKVTGDFTLRGVTKSIVLVAELTGKMVDDKGKTHLGFQASTKINRLDFGVAWNVKSKTGTLKVADEVEIVLQIEALLAK